MEALRSSHPLSSSIPKSQSTLPRVWTILNLTCEGWHCTACKQVATWLLKIKCTAKLRKTALNLFGCEKTICLVRSKFLQTTSQKISLCQGRLHRKWAGRVDCKRWRFYLNKRLYTSSHASMHKTLRALLMNLHGIIIYLSDRLKAAGAQQP